MSNEEYLDRVVAACLRPLVGSMIIAFLAITTARYLLWPAGWARDFAVVNGVTVCLILVCLMRSLKYPWKSFQSGAVHGTILLVLVTMGACFHFVLGIRNNFTGIVALILVACGAIMLDPLWAIVTSVTVLSMWSWAEFTTQRQLSWADLPPFVAAGLASFILFRHRRDFFKKQFALVETQIHLKDMLSQSLLEAQESQKKFEERIRQRADAREVTQEQIQRELKEKSELESLLQKLGEESPLGRLAGGVAHDFSNLLTVIRGNLESLLYSDEVQDPEIIEIIRDGLSEANEIDQLTHQLLAYGRRQALTRDPVSANSLLCDFARGMGALLPESTLLELDLRAGEALVVVDIPQINQALMNLCLNATESMPEGGRLVLKSYVSRGRVCLEVKDTGHGMSCQTLAKARDPYFTQKGFHAGRGLGLCVVEGILKQHDGTLDITSELNAGTVCTISLPHFQESALDPSTVLLVEDEPTSRLLADRYLKRLGYQVVSAATASEARDLFLHQSCHPGMLLVDIVLPDENGLALADSLKKLCPGLRVAVTSAHTHKASWPPGLHPQTPLLQKPYGLSSFREALEHAL